MGDETRIWRHYRREDMLRAKKHRRTSVRLFCESESCVKGGGLRDEKARKRQKEGERSSFSWRAGNRGRADRRVGERARGEGREGGGGGACQQLQPVRSRCGALQGESYPGNTMEGEGEGARGRDTVDR